MPQSVRITTSPTALACKTALEPLKFFSTGQQNPTKKFLKLSFWLVDSKVKTWTVQQLEFSVCAPYL